MKTVLGVILFLLGAGVAAAEAPGHEFVGAKKCAICHKTPAQGGQYGIWLESKHAKAFETLGTPAAAAIAQKAGVDDPSQSGQCLKCHSTAYGFTEKRASDAIAVEEGVSCESCHGPGKDYMKKSVMQDLRAAKAAGLLVPDEKTCLRCHNAGGPVPEDFDYKTYREKIKHPKPKV
ncbi:MAG: cytochrome C554 [Candidatus Omnitrophica bacterium]|nr:cytochrome C554 [Candidatus Omnitrophota bacterium]